jgi:hypothetical protein
MLMRELQKIICLKMKEKNSESLQNSEIQF